MAVNTRGILIAGLVSSIVMGMVSMLGEAVAGAGFWAAPTLIAATLLRDLQSLEAPVPFLFLPFVLGLMGHMMNSVILTGVFDVVLGQRAASVVARLIAGMAFGLMVFVVMWFVVLPIINPVMLILSPAVFAVAHLMWGAVLGALLALQGQR